MIHKIDTKAYFWQYNIGQTSKVYHHWIAVLMKLQVADVVAFLYTTEQKPQTQIPGGAHT